MSVGRPPGPDGGFLGLGNLLRYQTDLLGFLSEITTTYGDLVYFQAGAESIYLLNRPDLIGAAFAEDGQQLHKPTVLKDSNRGCWGDGLTTLEGEAWQQRRRWLQPAFHQQQITAYAPIVVRHTQAMIDTWQPGELVNLDEAMLQLTAAIMTGILFGTVPGTTEEDSTQEQIIPLSEALGEIFTAGQQTRGPFTQTLQRRRAGPTMPQTVKLIESHIADPTAQDDLLSTRLRAKAADDGQPEHEAIISEMMQLLFAGHHSIPTTLLWLWVSLARYPAIEAEVHRQLEQACTAEFLTAPPAQLPYLDWVLQEIMRVYSPLVLLPRQLTCGLTLDGYWLPPGATIWVCPPLIHHDPRYYEAPAEFRPERFAPYQAHPIPKYAYLPFGVGPRLCIGRALALMIMRLITATIARRYRLVLPAGQPVEPKVTLTLRPAAELWMQLEERQ